MKNADMPAMPLASHEQAMSLVASGVTKREYFAALALQGLCTRTGYRSPEDLAHDAVKAANALLAELEGE